MEPKKRIAIPTIAEVPNYVAALTNLGAQPVPVSEMCDPKDYDALLLPGGADIEPSRYGEAMNGTRWTNPALDELQFSVLDCFVKAGKPVFGICRGHQLINVYFGGTLIQDIPEAPAHNRIGGKDGYDNCHMTKAAPDSFLAALYGEAFPVNSAHHQAVGVVGEGLRVVQRADDGVIEALCHDKLPVYSVQWHPERMCFAHRREDTVDGSLVLRWFILVLEDIHV